METPTEAATCPPKLSPDSLLMTTQTTHKIKISIYILHMLTDCFLCSFTIFYASALFLCINYIPILHFLCFLL